MNGLVLSHQPSQGEEVEVRRSRGDSEASVTPGVVCSERGVFVPRLDL